MNKVSVVVYGADVVCASCVNAPTARNTLIGCNHCSKESIQISNLSLRILI